MCAFAGEIRRAACENVHAGWFDLVVLGSPFALVHSQGRTGQSGLAGVLGWGWVGRLFACSGVLGLRVIDTELLGIACVAAPAEADLGLGLGRLGRPGHSGCGGGV